MEKRAKIVTIVVAVLAVAAVVGLAVYTSGPPSKPNSSVIQVVAAENFWGSLIAQMGGTHVSVTSIVTDPNADPHEYEANASDARAIADAQLVIENGEGYDSWCSQLVGSSDTPGQVVLNVQNTLGVASGGNPHFWYNPNYVNITVHQMYSDLVSISPGNTQYFQQQYATLNASLGQLYGEAAAIKAHFAGTEVASTESIFVYLANFTNLDLVSPPAFMDAVAEGNDPPAQSVVVFQQQLESGNVSVLVYNAQTVSPLTSSMKAIAQSNNVTVIAVTETIQPPNVSFQLWMESEYLDLYNALNAKTLGQ
ncbi:MAG TPA: zinc ABC transporter substrate-binding protein [Thermoplasmata archaeon]|nr:zinc ABC transporter substrate-binding protein [Thermoplasmata archaeon]